MEQTFYWHWFHLLKGISQKEKEMLLELCPDVKEWYEAGEQKKITEYLPFATADGETDAKRRKLQESLESNIVRENAKKTYDELTKKEILSRDSMPEERIRLFRIPTVLWECL